MSKETVYIIGAGASYEAGLPTGDKLKKQIAELLDIKYDLSKRQLGDYELNSALRKFASNEKNFLTYLNECRHISRNMPLAISIDNFIDSERGNGKLALCGKLAIIKSILKAESDSKLSILKYVGKRKFSFSSLGGTWYLSFFRTLTENCRVEDLEVRLRKIVLIIFNYDRCIEHFLLHAFMSYYRLSENESAALVSSIEIIHPYGTIGSLGWEGYIDTSTSVDFGGELRTDRLIDHANLVRTFTEGAHSENMSTIILRMRYTERLVFLGFAFHKLNMDLLGGNSFDTYDNPNNISCFATAFETSASDQGSIGDSVRNLYENNTNMKINIENTTCCQMFSDYSRSLGYS